MNKVICLITIAFLPVLTFTQEEAKLNPGFYNTWIEYDYYNELMNCKTPVDLKIRYNNIQISIEKSPKPIFFRTLYEGIKRDYKIKNRDTIEVIDLDGNESLIYVTDDGNETKLVHSNKDTTLYYIALEKKYNVRNGVDHLINDMFLTGDYVAEPDTTVKVTFSTNGSFSGIGNYNKYSIPIKGVGLPTKFDIVLLLEIDKKVKNSILFHWEKTEDKLNLYNVRESQGGPNYLDKFVESEILDKHLTLMKIE